MSSIKLKEMNLLNKKIIITGASRGIGQAIALACAREGAYVGVNFFQSSAAAESLRGIDPTRLILLPFDVSDEAAATKGIQSFLSA
jgi:NAD(P)-dependent dehydrogenase (short-subunit alcohol dehydrogenase family)